MAQFNTFLVDCGFAIDWTSYQDHFPGDDTDARIVLTVIITGNNSVPMIVDTAAPWCILDPELVEAWGLMPGKAYAPSTKLNIRGITHSGDLVRFPVVLQGVNGQEVEIDATFFIPKLEPGEKWPFPNFLGLTGFLTHLRFAIDTYDNVFYFARSGD